ncbi:MAG: PIN domain-containing protein [Ilumatobacteraceae bacterium]
MTTLLDAFGLVAYLADEQCAAEVEELLRVGSAVSALNLAETIDRMARIYDREVDTDIDSMVAGGLDVLAVDAGIGRRAGRLRAIHFHAVRAPVSLADCVAAATALGHDMALATSDGPLAALVTTEGGRVVPLPDSNGVRPG